MMDWEIRTISLLGGAVLALAAGGCGTGDDNSTPVPPADSGSDSGAKTDAASSTDATLGDGGGDGAMADAGLEASGEAGDTGDDGATALARGEYLVKHVLACGDCHTPRTATGALDMTKWLAGVPGEFQVPGLGPDAGVGIIGAPNLTPDMTTGLGGWSTGQIVAAFTTGVDKDGKALFPIMPYYVFHNMLESDSDAIAAYLQSIPAVSNTVPERNFDLPGPAQPLALNDIPDPTLASTDPNYAGAIRGKYLAGRTGACIECHSPHVMGGLDTTKLFAGGDTFSSAGLGLPAPFPAVIFSQNITPDPTGIAGFSTTDVVNVLQHGMTPSGLPICPPMPVGPRGAFGGLTDKDALDIALYVTNLPPIVNTISPACHDVVAAAGDGGAESGSNGAPDAQE